MPRPLALAYRAKIAQSHGNFLAGALGQAYLNGLIDLQKFDQEVRRLRTVYVGAEVSEDALEALKLEIATIEEILADAAHAAQKR